jgi:Fe-S oxidoreductase
MERYIPNKLKNDIMLCNRCRCGFCESRCPTYTVTHIESLSARGRNLLALALLEGYIPLSKTLADRFFTCTTCGFCKEICPLEVDTVKIVQNVRTYLIKEGLYDSSINIISKNIMKYSNPYGKPIEDKSAWSKDLHFYRDGKTLLFGGCVYPFQNPEVLKITAQLLQKAGLKLNYLPNEPCCGYPLLALGFQEDFEDLARKNAELFMKAGVEEIVANCPGCVETLKQYSEYIGKVDFKVLHIVDYLKELIEKGRIQLSHAILLEVTYHDPCHLTRYLKKYEEPREIIRSITGVTLKEKPHNKMESLCCGGGGGMLVTNPDTSSQISDILLREIQETGVTTVVTACPTCERVINFTADLKGAKIKCIDIVELVNKAVKG